MLLLGADGQVGWELRRALAPLAELTALKKGLNPGGMVADLSDAASLLQLLRTLRPQVVINAAAYTAVDQAESDAQRANAINAVAPGIIAQQLRQWSGWMVHYSTDYVFDGSGVSARDEQAPTGPLNVYGRTKLAGEDAIRASGCQHLILRTSWVLAARGANFARTMLRLASERDALRVVDDQIGAPTGAELLADVTAHALRSALASPALAGTYHCSAGGEVSWFDYARHVIAWGHRAGLALRARPEDVSGIATREYPTPAARPLNSRLDTTKFRHAFGLRLPPWQDGVDRMLDEARPTFTSPCA